jgi:L-threonylcarbamoyladenylate synthase
MKNHKIIDRKIAEIIKNNGVGVLPTDTLFGLVGSAFSKKAVAKIYKIKKRNPKSPCIILISAIDDLEKFNIQLNENSKEFLQKNWPGKISTVLPCSDKKFEYLHRGTKSLAFRFPNKSNLVNLIKKTGPLVAPSANPEKLEPAQNIVEARKYFGDKVDFYISGKTSKLHSTLVEIKNGKIKVLRKGAGKIKS